MPFIGMIRLLFFSLAFLLPASPALGGLVDFSNALLDHVARRFGWEAPRRLQTMQLAVRQFKVAAGADFKQVTARSPDATTEMPILRKVNDFFNQVPYFSDIEHWKVADYWATPVELVASYGGDCEDYSIAKYMTLKELGVPVERLRITYVRAIRLGVTHMVLAYYPSPDADPWILDNLEHDVRRASARTDLAPVYSFNDDDLWMAGTASKGGAGNVRLWKDLREKMVREMSM